MTLNQIGKLFLKLAKDKGWGHTKEMLEVSEKMMLINTEITELYEAISKGAKNPKDTVESETADILGRTLHLGLVWGVDFDKDIQFNSRFSKKKGELNKSDYLYMHSLVSRGYDYYRHKKTSLFKKHLYIIAKEMVYLAKSMGIDINKAVVDKVKINQKRSWDKNKLHGNYYKSR
jgi:NTP pyrophosphatase (non-canonical NTP hydrolase)